jgi:serine/threonine-protein kinase RsbW
MPPDLPSLSLRKRLPSDLRVGNRFVEEIGALLMEHGWPSREIYAVQLAVEEGLANAMRHGNRLDRSKHVRVACHLNGERIQVEIADEGPGFKPNTVPDPTLDENLERPGGRGLLLMRSYMTRVEYNAAGNAVTMEKIRSRAS